VFLRSKLATIILADLLPPLDIAPTDLLPVQSFRSLETVFNSLVKKVSIEASTRLPTTFNLGPIAFVHIYLGL
jgi:hypothetical protein